MLLLVATIVSPAIDLGRQFLTLDQHQPIAPRYFLIALPFVFLALAELLAPKLRRGGVGRALAIAVIVSFIFLNLREILRFLRVGRGHYSDAVSYISENSPAAGQLSILSDHEWRTTNTLKFYAARLLAEQQTLYVYDANQRDPDYSATGPPMWFIRHLGDVGAPPADSYTDPKTRMRYLFDREFPYYGLSGYSWYVYRRSDLLPAEPPPRGF
jgi:hypothetical protein